jgi:hypothetical protein
VRKISPHRDSTPDRPARSQSLYRLRYPAHSEEIESAENFGRENRVKYRLEDTMMMMMMMMMMKETVKK